MLHEAIDAAGSRRLKLAQAPSAVCAKDNQLKLALCRSSFGERPTTTVWAGYQMFILVLKTQGHIQILLQHKTVTPCRTIIQTWLHQCYSHTQIGKKQNKREISIKKESERKLHVDKEELIRKILNLDSVGLSLSSSLCRSHVGPVGPVLIPPGVNVKSYL